MPNLFKRDGITTGLLLSIGSEALTAALLWIGLVVAAQPVASHLRWFGICFVAPLLLLRLCAKRRDLPVATKTIIIVLFVTFVAFMFLLFRTKAIEL